MSSPPSFDDLMARLHAGDPKAADQVYQRYFQQLIALARSHLDGLILQKVNPEDVVQSVYKSFFVRQHAGQFELVNWKSLWGLLAEITLRKCARKAEHFHAAKRDIRKEVRARSPVDDSAPILEAVAHEPTPAEAAVLAETVEQLMRALERRQQEIVALSLQGYKPAEISKQIGRAERTVQRTLGDVRNWLEKRQHLLS